MRKEEYLQLGLQELTLSECIEVTGGDKFTENVGAFLGYCWEYLKDFITSPGANDDLMMNTI